MANLPQELIHEILLYLPVKSLFRFKCFCKWFSATINSINRRCVIYLQPNYDPPSYIKVRALDINIGGGPRFRQEVFWLDIKPSQFIDSCIINHASCNGLILFPIGSYELVLLNPSTREYKYLPFCPVNVIFGETILNLGYDSSRDDYKVLVMKKVSENSPQWGVWIFGFRSRFWKKIQDFPYGSPYKGSNCFIDGALYFLCNGSQSGSYKIAAFDVAKENFGTFWHVNCAGERFPSQLQVIDGCLWLCLAHPNHDDVDIFVGKKDGVEFTWSLLCSINSKQYSYILKFGEFLGYSKEGKKILFMYDKNIYAYDLRRRNFETVETINIDQSIEFLVLKVWFR